MANYYKTKVQTTDSLIKYWVYSKPITYDYESKRQNYQKAKEGLKRQDSLNRSRSKMIDLIDANVNYYSKFITLTLNDSYKSVDRNQLIEMFKTFKKYFKRKFKKSISYVGVIEKQFKRQKKYNLDKAPLHIHLIVFITQKLDFKTLKKCWPYGSIDIKKVDDNANLSIYIAKYLTKENVKLNKKAFISSRNLQKPSCYNSTDIIIPDNATYENTYLGFQNGIKDIDHVMQVKYFEVRRSKLDKKTN